MMREMNTENKNSRQTQCADAHTRVCSVVLEYLNLQEGVHVRVSK